MSSGAISDDLLCGITLPGHNDPILVTHILTLGLHLATRIERLVHYHCCPLRFQREIEGLLTPKFLDVEGQPVIEGLAFVEIEPSCRWSS